MKTLKELTWEHHKEAERQHADVDQAWYIINPNNAWKLRWDMLVRNRALRSIDSKKAEECCDYEIVV